MTIWRKGLKSFFDGLTEIVRQYQPDQFAIERVFMAKNADSALKLGQARGAAIVAATNADLPVAEYSATQIKSACCRYWGELKKSKFSTWCNTY